MMHDDGRTKTRMNTRTINPVNVASCGAHDQSRDTQDRHHAPLPRGATRRPLRPPVGGRGPGRNKSVFGDSTCARPEAAAHPVAVPASTPDAARPAVHGGARWRPPLFSRAPRPPRRPMCRRLLFYVGVVVVSSGAPVFRFGRDALSPHRVAVNLLFRQSLPSFGLSRHSRPDVSPRNRLAVDV